MDFQNYVDEFTSRALQRLFPEVELQSRLTPMAQATGSSIAPRPPESAVNVDLPVPSGAEYSISLCLYPEKQIYAQLPLGNSRGAFWYMAFEEAAYSNSVDKLDDAFVKILEFFVSYETRIVQRHGFVFESFSCEYKDDVAWHRIGRLSYLRVGGFQAAAHFREEEGLSVTGVSVAPFCR